MWSTRIHDTQTGNFLAHIEVSASPWGRGSQTLRESQVVLDDGLSQSQWRGLLANFWDRVLVQCWNGVPVYAGLIFAAPSYDSLNKIVTIRHGDPSYLLNRRWMHGVGPSTGGGGYVPTGTFSVSGRSLRGALVDILHQAYRAPVSGAWPIPVDLPAATSGSFSKTWYFYQFENAADMVREIVESDNGPDIDLRPYFDAAGKLRWEQRIGNPRLSGSTIEVNLTAEHDAPSVEVGVDGIKTATGIHYPGKGSEVDMRVGSAAAPVSAGLARDTLYTDKNEDSVARLSSRAAGLLSVLRSPTEQWSFTLNAMEHSPSGIQIGSTIRTYSQGDPWIPDGWKNHRVVGFSGDLSNVYDVEVQEA